MTPKPSFYKLNLTELRTYSIVFRGTYRVKGKEIIVSLEVPLSAIQGLLDDFCRNVEDFLNQTELEPTLKEGETNEPLKV